MNVMERKNTVKGNGVRQRKLGIGIRKAGKQEGCAKNK
jgi:hypothetical protein